MKYKKVNQDINNIVNEQVRKLESIFPAAVKDGEVDFDEYSGLGVRAVRWLGNRLAII